MYPLGDLKCSMVLSIWCKVIFMKEERRRKVKKVLGGERFFLYGEGEWEVDRGLGFCQSRIVIKGRSE